MLPLGEGLWKSMKAAGTYRLAVTDPDAGQIALITTVVEDHADPAQGTPALLALRLKVADGRITEIEQVVERNPHDGAARRSARLAARGVLDADPGGASACRAPI